MKSFLFNRNINATNLDQKVRIFQQSLNFTQRMMFGVLNNISKQSKNNFLVKNKQVTSTNTCLTKKSCQGGFSFSTFDNKRNRINLRKSFQFTNKMRFFGRQGGGSSKDYYSKSLINNYLEILGVDKGSSKDQIKKAYFKLAKEWHPDNNKAAGAKEKFSEIAE